MPTRHAFLRTLLATAAATLLPLAAQAQTFPIPGKPVRIVVPFPAGGQTDIQARLLASKLQTSLGTTVIVENKPGASSILGTMEVVRAPADGHTLLYTISVTAGQNPHLFSELPQRRLYQHTKHVCRMPSTRLQPDHRSKSPGTAVFNRLRDLPQRISMGAFHLRS